MGKTIVTHSYKGGTGKTLFTMNLASLLAIRGYRVVVLDMDLSAPSIHSFIPRNLLEKYPKINDALLTDIPISEVLIDMSDSIQCSGKLWFGVSSNTTDDILRITRRTTKEFNQDASKLFQWISTLKSNPYNADYIVIDTSPGISFTSINCVATADIAYVLFRVLTSDITGTREMLLGLHSKMGCEIRLVPNQVPEAYMRNPQTHDTIRKVIERSLEVDMNPDVILDDMIFQEPSITEKEILNLLNDSEDLREFHVVSESSSGFKSSIEKLCQNLIDLDA